VKRYHCDRCGRTSADPCDGAVKSQDVEQKSWCNTNEPPTPSPVVVRVVASFLVLLDDAEQSVHKPDLCAPCRGRILRECAAAIERDVPKTLPTIPGTAPEEP
jgi:hypothetical protein